MIARISMGHHLKLLQLLQVLLTNKITNLGICRLTELLEFLKISSVCKLHYILLHSEIWSLLSSLTFLHLIIKLPFDSLTLCLFLDNLRALCVNGRTFLCDLGLQLRIFSFENFQRSLNRFKFFIEPIYFEFKIIVLIIDKVLHRLQVKTQIHTLHDVAE